MQAQMQPRILNLQIPEEEIPSFLEELTLSGRQVLVALANQVAERHGYVRQPQPAQAEAETEAKKPRLNKVPSK